MDVLIKEELTSGMWTYNDRMVGYVCVDVLITEGLAGSK